MGSHHPPPRTLDEGASGPVSKQVDIIYILECSSLALDQEEEDEEKKSWQRHSMKSIHLLNLSRDTGSISYLMGLETFTMIHHPKVEPIRVRACVPKR